MEKDENYRNKWAFGLATFFSILIFLSFSFYKGFLNFEIKGKVAEQKSSNQVANVISANSVPSPIENTKKTLNSAFEEIGKQYQIIQNSLSEVLVPFFTGIEIYERK